MITSSSTTAGPFLYFLTEAFDLEDFADLDTDYFLPDCFFVEVFFALLLGDDLIDTFLTDGYLDFLTEDYLGICSSSS